MVELIRVMESYATRSRLKTLKGQGRISRSSLTKGIDMGICVFQA